ncbi:AB24G protein, partial [Grallaria varia]|nr:AB24G protein [Grallaria varia]
GEQGGPCPVSHFCPGGSSFPSPFATEFPCPRGYYNPDAMTQSLDSCLPCPPGHYCGKEGLTAPSGHGPCSPGYYCTSKARVPNPGRDGTGSLCPAGHYCPPGSSKPQPCPAGTFLPQSGMVFHNSCLPCPAGKFC